MGSWTQSRSTSGIGTGNRASSARRVASESPLVTTSRSPRTSTATTAGQPTDSTGEPRGAASRARREHGAHHPPGREPADLGHRPVGHHSPPAQQHHAVGEGLGLRKVVRGEDDSAAADSEVVHGRPERMTGADAHRGGGLVEYQVVRVAGAGVTTCA